MSLEFAKTLRDKQIVGNARKLRDEYLKKHEELHVSMQGAPLYQALDEALNVFQNGLFEMGFESIGQFDSADRFLTHLEKIEEAKPLEGISFDNSDKVLNFFDISSLPYQFSCATTEVLTHRSDTGVMPNSFIFNWVKLDRPWGLIRYKDTPESLAHKARLEAEGIQPFRSVLTGRDTPPYAKDDVYLRIYTSELVGSPEEAFIGVAAVATRMFNALGIKVVSLEGTNDLFEISTGKKIAGGMCYRYHGVNIGIMICYRDFDYDVGARVFQDPNIANRVITVKDVIGYEPDAKSFKTAVLAALPDIFGCDVINKRLTKSFNAQLEDLAEKYTGDCITSSLVNPDDVKAGKPRLPYSHR